MVLSGKTIIVADDNSGIASVSSFSFMKTERSRQNNDLRSTDMDIGYGVIFAAGFLLIAAIPGAILGSFFKGLSYIKNTKAQESHQKVKNRLTPENISIVFSKSQPTDTTMIKQRLDAHLMSGQKTKALIISGNVVLDDACMRKIYDISPPKLILDGIKARKSKFDREDWDNRALDHLGDYSSFASISSSFVSAPSKKTPGILSSVGKDLKNFHSGILQMISR